ncbi:MAG: hypothetical protein PHH54_00500 [Candidatus Nanoarchaeia archaeon]|nr:hypothetical protein [Candidatus Nanoarchaeia archaeon]MDD5740443.1 hypothetical protein [Candidatus Nanoarchaeia archaeon]
MKNQKQEAVSKTICKCPFYGIYYLNGSLYEGDENKCLINPYTNNYCSMKESKKIPDLISCSSFNKRNDKDGLIKNLSGFELYLEKLRIIGLPEQKKVTFQNWFDYIMKSAG